MNAVTDRRQKRNPLRGFGHLLLTLIAIAFFPSNALASRFFWVAGGQVGQWNADANWSGEGLPGPADEATLSGGNHAIVDHARVGTLILFGHLASGRMEVVESAFINNSRFSLGHQLLIESNARALLDGFLPTRITGGSQFINQGTTEVVAFGELQFEDGGSILNQTKSNQDPTAQFIVRVAPQFNNGISDLLLTELSGTGSRFINEGAEFINRSPGGTTTFNLAFDNNGVVSAELGSIVFKKGGLHKHGAFLTQGAHEIIFEDGDHIFELDQGNIRMGKGIVWSGGNFRFRKIGGKIAAEGLNIRNATANMLGAGLMEVDDLLYEPNGDGANLLVGDAVELIPKQFAIFKNANGAVLVDGTLRLKSPSVVLHQGSKLVNRSTGEIRFEAALSQTIRDVDGESKIENDGLIQFLSETNLVTIPIDNRGRMEIHKGTARFTKEFDSKEGNLQVKDSAKLELEGKVSLGQGAVIGSQGEIKISTKNPVHLAGEFEGSGKIEFADDKSVTVEGEAQFSGPDLDFRRMGIAVRNYAEIQYGGTSGTAWTVNPSSDPDSIGFSNAWIFGDSGRFIGPATIQNFSNDLTWIFNPSGNKAFHMGFSALNVNVKNEGALNVRSGNGKNFGILLQQSTLDNSGELFIGANAASVVFETSSGSRIINRKGAAIMFGAKESSLFRQTSSDPSAVMLQNEGDLKVGFPGSDLVLNVNSRHEGSITLNGSRLVMNHGTHVFAPNSKVISMGGEPSSIDASSVELVIEDELVYDGAIEFYDSVGSTPTVLKVPINGGLRAKSVGFDLTSNRAEPAVTVTIPNNFFPKSNEGASFPVLQADQILGLKKEHVAIETIPGQAIEYSVDIEANALRIGVLHVPSDDNLDFEETFDLWTQESFESGETRTKPEDDPDGDGKTNIHEFGIGSDPTVPEDEGLKIEHFEDNGETKTRLVYPKSIDAKGVKIEVEQSDSLESPFAPLDPEIKDAQSESPDLTDSSRVKVHLPILPKRHTHQFYRLKVIQNP